MQTVIGDERISVDVRDKITMIKMMAGSVSQLAWQFLVITGTQDEILTIDLRDTILQLTHLIERLLGENNRLQTSLDDGLWPVQVDEMTIGEILLSLVANAREAMPGGGTLCIRARNVTKAQCQAQLKSAAFAADYVLVEVTDEGIGIPEEIMCRLFEPFATTKGWGHGFGLAKVQHTVRGLNGHIICQSRAGHGTTFEMFLPPHNAAPLE